MTDLRGAMKCDRPVVEAWAQKLAALVHEDGWGIYADWLEAFLSDIRRARCEGLPREVRRCGHENLVEGMNANCAACLLAMGRREGHCEAGVYWHLHEVTERMRGHIPPTPA